MAELFSTKIGFEDKCYEIIIDDLKFTGHTINIENSDF